MPKKRSKIANSKNKYEKELLPDGTKNPKYIDLLDEDRAISGQKFCCLSFVSPEHLIKGKDMFFFEKFVDQWDINKSMDKFTQFLNFMTHKHNLNIDDTMNDFKEFVESEKDDIYKSTITDDYKTFMERNEERLEGVYSKKHNFQTCVRGLKLRGCFPSQEEAELRCKMIRELDPNHDVFVGPVGVWIPWDPDAYRTGRIEYMKEELNELMHEKNTSDIASKTHFEEEVQKAKHAAVIENTERSKKFGSSVTQTINKDGQLVAIKDTNTQVTDLLKNDELTIDDIKNELFEGDNIVTEKNGDKGLSLLTINNPLNKKNEEDADNDEKE